MYCLYNYRLPLIQEELNENNFVVVLCVTVLHVDLCCVVHHGAPYGPVLCCATLCSMLTCVVLCVMVYTVLRMDLYCVVLHGAPC